MDKEVDLLWYAAIGAVAKNSNVISVRPLESGIKTYAVYIAGFWFV